MILVMSSSKPKEKNLAFGGQALMEGIMMRSGNQMVLCIRNPSNEIVTHGEEINSIVNRNRILGLPFIRGGLMLFETMYYGMKGIFYSANIALEEEEEQFTWKEYLLVIVMVLAMSAFFMVVPFILTNYFNLTGIIFNIVESGVRMAFFLSYLYLVSRWGEFQRILMYHGAEHKAINAYEAGDELTVENVVKHSRLNPRCGTSFLFIVVIMSIILYSLISVTDFYTKIAYRILLIPVLGSISYELLKFSSKYQNSPIIKLVTIPGLAFQRFTTKEPESDMIEVAIVAIQEVEKRH